MSAKKTGLKEKLGEKKMFVVGGPVRLTLFPREDVARHVVMQNTSWLNGPTV